MCETIPIEITNVSVTMVCTLVFRPGRCLSLRLRQPDCRLYVPPHRAREVVLLADVPKHTSLKRCVRFCSSSVLIDVVINTERTCVLTRDTFNLGAGTITVSAVVIETRIYLVHLSVRALLSQDNWS